MPSIDSPRFAALATQVLGSLLLAVTFLHSGIDMALDRKGNLSFLERYFGKAPRIFQQSVPVLLAAIVVLEILGGGLCLAGAVQLLVNRHRALSAIGCVLCAVSLLCLLFGQKFAKDHPGSASLMGYCAVTLITLYALAS